MRKITKKEKRKIAGIVLLGLSLTLISSPLDNFFKTTFTSTLVRFLVGVVGLVVVAYLWDLTKI